MRRRVISTFPLSIAVCLLLALVAQVSVLAQKRTAQTPKTAPKTTATTVTKANATAKADVKMPATTVTAKVESGQTIGFMSQVEREILDEMNLARAEPQRYAAFVEEYKKYYDGNRLMIPGRKKALVTSDGVAAVDEAVQFLRAQSPLPALSVAKGMCLAAKDHANDLATKGLSGHLGSDGSMPNARVDRYGHWEGTIGETIVYELSPARQIVIALIIDDGVPNRGHRRNIFDPSYKVAGVSIVENPSNGPRCVVDYAGGFKEKAPEGGN